MRPPCERMARCLSISRVAGFLLVAGCAASVHICMSLMRAACLGHSLQEECRNGLICEFDVVCVAIALRSRVLKSVRLSCVASSDGRTGSRRHEKRCRSLRLRFVVRCGRSQITTIGGIAARGTGMPAARCHASGCVWYVVCCARRRTLRSRMRSTSLFASACLGSLSAVILSRRRCCSD